MVVFLPTLLSPTQLKNLKINKKSFRNGSPFPSLITSMVSCTYLLKIDLIISVYNKSFEHQIFNLKALKYSNLVKDRPNETLSVHEFLFFHLEIPIGFNSEKRNQ